MTKKELLARVVALESRVKVLEELPVSMVPYVNKHQWTIPQYWKNPCSADANDATNGHGASHSQ